MEAALLAARVDVAMNDAIHTTSSTAPVLLDGEVMACWTVNARELRVRALRPSSDPEVAGGFESARGAALRRHAVEQVAVISSRPRARMDGQTWLLVVERSGDAGLHAGIRLDLHHPLRPLQIERALARFGAEPLARLRDRLHQAAGEFTGLWVDDEFRGCGLPAALVSAGIAAARRIGLTRLVTLLPAHTRGLFEAEGFRIVRELGGEDGFPYPDERYRSWVAELDLPRAEDLREAQPRVHVVTTEVARLPLAGLATSHLPQETVR